MSVWCNKAVDCANINLQTNMSLLWNMKRFLIKQCVGRQGHSGTSDKVVKHTHLSKTSLGVYINLGYSYEGV